MDVAHNSRLEEALVQVPEKETPSVEVSIVMPCLNEADTLETCIRKAQRALREHNIAGEIIVADNGSTDGSQAIAIRAGSACHPRGSQRIRQRSYGGYCCGARQIYHYGRRGR